MILLSYDGSADAKAAIERAAELMPGQYATVLTVWVPFMDSMARTCAPGMGIGMAGTYAYADAPEIDQACSAAALATATDGAERATAAGLVASPLTQARDGDVASTILAVATDLDASVIAMGTRGLNRVKALLLGSVSHVVVQHADRAVLVVPSRALVERRQDRVAREVARV